MKSYILKVFSEAEVEKIHKLADDITLLDKNPPLVITTRKVFFGLLNDEFIKYEIPKHLKVFVRAYVYNSEHHGCYINETGKYLVDLSKQLKMSRDAYLDHEASSIVSSVLG